jgi:hypothetical protein
MKKHELYFCEKTVVELLEWNDHDVIVRHHGGGEEILTRAYFENNYSGCYGGEYANAKY